MKLGLGTCNYSSSISSRERTTRKKASKEAAVNLRPNLPIPQQLLVEVAGEKGVSSWLVSPPTTHQKDNILNKREFCDGLVQQYGCLDDTPGNCVCRSEFTITHMQTCPTGGYPTACHNQIRDFLSEVLTEVLEDVKWEPALLPLSGEDLPGTTTNRADAARADIRAHGFWTRRQNAFFDVRVTHPKASLLSCWEVRSQLSQAEASKKRQYGRRVIKVDHGSFTLLVFATNGQCGRECSMFLKALATAVAEKHHLPYATVIHQLRARLSFCLLRWQVACLRGSQRSYHCRGNPVVAQCQFMASKFV